ncbi:MAG TPA: DNA-directed RNA polymerase subunit omega [Pyrinomonadaceae bacterium]|nr:DNA-directed RNA polymerase subunit omega [Pyrinomonadaceae bacterium]HLE61717.1 DNA-directed RNA polymerase subunit omega [Pyrinomonadaceae bacterium]
MTPAKEVENIVENNSQEIDSKYRLIILAAKRSKQLQRGARPRIDIDAQKHKPTRIALEEVMRGKVHFHIKESDKELSTGG